MDNYRLGIVADTFIQLENLKKLVSACGFVVAYAQKAQSADVSKLPQVDAWVVGLDLNRAESTAVYDHLEATSAPVIFDDQSLTETEAEIETEQEQKKRFYTKIYECVGRQYTTFDNTCENQKSSTLATSSGVPAEEVWVLAASTGGPEAVNCFLSELNNIPEYVSFLYVQHIDSSMHESLNVMLRKHKYLTIENTTTSKQILGGRLYLINPDEQIDISQAGVIVPTSNPWQGIYKPSIDQVMAKTARCYKKKCGVIIFSGMGDDGAASCRFFKSYGGRIFVQSPESCTIDSMPDSAMQMCDVTYQGSPVQLAKKFTQTYELVT